jgi:hypothetical protein
VATACANLPKVEPAGRWNFWPTPWSSSPNTKACRARQCAGVWPKTVSSHGARICGAFHRSTANMSPAWKTCSTSMPKRPIANGRWSTSTRARVQLIGEVRQPIPVEPGQLERYDCEYRRNGTVNLFVCIDVHRSWRKVKVHRTEDGRKTTPNARANSSMSTIPMPRASGSSRTTCRPIRPAPSMKHSRPPKPGEFCKAWSSTTPPSMPVASTWSRSRSACSAVSASIADDDPKCLIPEIAAREKQRNDAGSRIKWMFTTEKARAKTDRAYPVTPKDS